MIRMMVFLLAGLLLAGSAYASGTVPTKAIKHGKFLIGYGGCNDCHTPGWGAHGGHAPKDLLLYAYIHSLGAAGKPAHAYVPPGHPAPSPYLKLVTTTVKPARPAHH